MKRRELIAVLGGAATWPLATRAQQGDRMRRIQVLLPVGTDDAEFQTRVGAFLQALQQLGWTIGRNVEIDIRWATANADAIRKHAAELAALAPRTMRKDAPASRRSHRRCSNWAGARGPQSAHRHSRHGQCRRASQARGGTGRTGAR